jgi:hypothetical protein
MRKYRLTIFDLLVLGSVSPGVLVYHQALSSSKFYKIVILYVTFLSSTYSSSYRYILEIHIRIAFAL